MKVPTMGSALVALSVLAASLLFGSAAGAAEPPKTPQQVAGYFANGLVPRLIDLYGSGNGVTKGIDFDATTTVGSISRVMEWTPDFLAGHSGADPTRLTNNWVASVSLRGDVLGLATVWINPANDLPELASFDSAALARQLAAAPPGSLLVRDPPRGAWFALSKDILTPLVSGSSGVTLPTTPTSYQKSISTVVPVDQAAPPGVAIAALVLGIVIFGLAIFVLLPLRRQSTRPEDEAMDDDAMDADGSASTT